MNISIKYRSPVQWFHMTTPNSVHLSTQLLHIQSNNHDSYGFRQTALRSDITRQQNWTQYSKYHQPYHNDIFEHFSASMVNRSDLNFLIVFLRSLSVIVRIYFQSQHKTWGTRVRNQNVAGHFLSIFENSTNRDVQVTMHREKFL